MADIYSSILIHASLHQLEAKILTGFLLQHRSCRRRVNANDSKSEVVSWSAISIVPILPESKFCEGAAGIGEIYGSALLNRYLKDFLRLYLAEDMWSFCQALGPEKLSSILLLRSSKCENAAPGLKMPNTGFFPNGDGSYLN